MGQVFDFIANSADGVFAVDRGQRIVLWNAGATEILGYRPDDAIGRNCYRIVRGLGEDGCGVCRPDCDVVQTAETLNLPPTRDLQVRNKDNEKVWVNLSTVLVPAADHDLSVIVHMFRDVSRERVPPHKDGIFDADRSGWFALYNINKLGMTVDMATPEGLALVKRLVEWADVLMESFRPGVMKKFGLDYDSVKKLNPNIIYASTSMFGHTGPYTNFAGFGHHAASVTGFYNIVGWPDRAPSGAFWAYTDNIAPQFLASAITTALIHRQKTGEGVYIEQSQNETSMQLLSPYLLDYSINGRIWNRCGNQDPFMAPHGAYPCLGDDRWCAIAVTSENEWQTFCEIMDKPDLADDEKFCTLQARKENEDELNRIIGKWTAQYEAKTLMNRLQENGVAAGLIATAEDMHHDPQFKYRRYYYSIDHPVIGPHPVNALPFRLSRTPAQVYQSEPCLGEHNSYVCTDILNMSDEEFVALLEADAFGSLE